MPYVVMRDRKDGTPLVIVSRNGLSVEADITNALFDTGAEAAAYRYEMARSYPDITYIVQEYVADRDPHWQGRERRRLFNGHYVRTPWYDEHWTKDLFGDDALFEHMCSKSPGLISYTENADKGEQDKQARAMAPGRFLKKFYGDMLKDEEIERWVAKCASLSGQISLKVTADADTIEEVYVNGPRSCMSGKHWHSGIHPARVYAGPDLAVAYLGDPEEGVSARCVVWPAKKLYSTIYGDVSRMQLALQGAGFTKGDMEGARVRRIQADYGFVMPYVDGINYADDEGDYLRLGDGDLETHNTCGTTASDECYSTCEDCSERYNHEEVGITDYRGRCIGPCCEADYRWLESHQEYFPLDDLTCVHGSNQDYYPDRDLHDGTYYEVTEGRHAWKYWAADCVRICEDCEAVMHEDDAEHRHGFETLDGEWHEVSEDVLCESCRDSRLTGLENDCHVTAYYALTPLERAIYIKEPANEDHTTDPAFAGSLVLGEATRQLHGETVLQGVSGHRAGDAIGPVWQPHVRYSVFEFGSPSA